METRGSIGEVWIIKVVESLADFDGSINIDLGISLARNRESTTYQVTTGVILHPTSSAVDPTRGSVSVVVGESVRFGPLVKGDIDVNVKLPVSLV
jgi:hypothetical protein